MSAPKVRRMSFGRVRDAKAAVTKYGRPSAFGFEGDRLVMQWTERAQ